MDVDREAAAVLLSSEQSRRSPCDVSDFAEPVLIASEPETINGELCLVRLVDLTGKVEYEITFDGRNEACGWLLAQVSSKEPWRVVPRSWWLAREISVRREAWEAKGSTLRRMARVLFGWLLLLDL